jgi:hypothetical protein
VFEQQQKKTARRWLQGICGVFDDAQRLLLTGDVYIGQNSESLRETHARVSLDKVQLYI